MKRTIVIIALLLLLAGCKAPAAESMEHMTMGPAMKIHGGAQGSLDFMDATIAFERPTAETGKPVPLKFTLTRQGEPLTELQIMHDKLMHVILVRKDLKHFDHIHPQQTTPGTFVVPYTFAAAGEYRIWTDFMYGNMQNFIDFDLNVTGQPEAEEPNRLYGLHVDMSKPDMIQHGKPAKLSFTITNEHGAPAPITEKFLGADGHIIVIDETLDEFEHTHDETGDRDNLLLFEYTPEKPGGHNAWVQFNVNGTDRTAAFEFSVS